jgi:hypothetical protein
LRILALCASALGALSGQTKQEARSWTPPKTAWGDPDLQGVWTSDDFYGAVQRPAQYGNRRFLNDEEYAARAKETDLRFTRLNDRRIHHEVTIYDSKTYTAPWTVAFEVTDEPGYQIFEYACHEGNYAMRNSLSAARAEETAQQSKFCPAVGQTIVSCRLPRSDPRIRQTTDNDGLSHAGAYSR